MAQSQDPPKSLAEIARQAKNEAGKEHARIVLTEDSPQAERPLIPDVFSGGFDNTDEILKSIDSYRLSHNPKETEQVVRIWFEKHDAMLASAIEQNRQIDQHEKDRQMGYLASDAQPRSQQEYVEAQRIEIISRREDSKRKQENGLLSARIQQTFTRVRASLAGKGMKYEWFKIRCGNGNCSY
ncbi:MAG TPA: hypothetical protein VE783_11315 [Candidatus Limnocylindrales bacterium]|nr:hypothetical protein [Candidatus Limnocylindrales bacterium]